MSSNLRFSLTFSATNTLYITSFQTELYTFLQKNDFVNNLNNVLMLVVGACLVCLLIISSSYYDTVDTAHHQRSI